MTSDEIDEAEIEDHLSDCAKDRHRWAPQSGGEILRAEATCIVCKGTLTDAQIALLKPEPLTNHFQTMYEDMEDGPGGMVGTSVVYQRGVSLENTRREATLSYDQFESLKEMGKVIE